MKLKWLYISLIGVLLVGIIVGSFLDLQVSQALYSKNNGFGLTMSAFGEVPSFMALVIMGTGFLFLGKYYVKTYQRVIFIALFIATFVISTYFQGSHIFNINAYYNPKMKFVGYLIGFVLSLLAAGLGYLLFKNRTLSPKRTLYILIFLCVVFGVSIGLNQLVKIIMSRPRFRFLKEMDVIQEYYCNWWQRGRYIRNLYLNEPVYFPNGVLITSEEFKSFPSGHVNNAMFLVVFMGTLPVFSDKIKIRKEILIGIAIVFTFLLAFTRILVGAHFLSDVSFGGLITVLVALVLNYIFMHFYGQIGDDPLPEEIEVSKEEIVEEAQGLEQAE